MWSWYLHISEPSSKSYKKYMYTGSYFMRFIRYRPHVLYIGDPDVWQIYISKNVQGPILKIDKSQITKSQKKNSMRKMNDRRRQ